jgi:hypothetical protein
VDEWLSYPGSRNFGVLLRCIRGTVSVFSGLNPLIAQRPALDIELNTTGVSLSYPDLYGDTPWQIFVSPRGSDITGLGNELYPFASLKKAVFEAFPADVINLKNGTYSGGTLFVIT